MKMITILELPMNCRTIAAALFLVCSSTLSSCSKQEGTSGQNQIPVLTQGSQSDSVAGITWRVSGRWTPGPARQMRVATYGIPAAHGGKEGSECSVYYFGPSDGGDVEANMTRWIGQFEPTGDPVRSSKTVDGMKIHLIDLSGVYIASTGPMMGGPKERKEGYRMLAAIVEGPEGSVFFKTTGPAASIAAAEREFNELVGSFSKM